MDRNGKEDIEMERRDLTDAEFQRLSLDEKKHIVSKSMKMKRDVFHSNLMMLTSNFLPSEINELTSKSVEGLGYLDRLVNQCGGSKDQTS